MQLSYDISVTTTEAKAIIEGLEAKLALYNKTSPTIPVPEVNSKIDTTKDLLKSFKKMIN